MIKAKEFLEIKQEEHFKQFGVYADTNSKIAEWIEEYASYGLSVAAEKAEIKVMELEDNKEKIDKFFNSKSKEELQELWKKYDKYSPSEFDKAVKLEPDESIVEDFISLTGNKVGILKTKTDVQSVVNIK